LIPALPIGKGLIVTGMTATDERKKYVDFTEPYYPTPVHAGQKKRCGNAGFINSQRSYV